MSSKHFTTANLTDAELKEQGNRLFTARKFEEAIQCYTKAIIKNPTVAIYFTNRALCHLKMKNWDQSCSDCRRALEIEQNQVKAHFFLGQSLMELELYDEAVKHLQRALDLARDQRRNYGDDIASQLRLARKKRWNVQEEKRICREIELQSYLNRLIQHDLENRIAQLKLDENVNEDAVKEERAEIERTCEDHTTELNNLFAKMDEKRRKREVPDYLCGKISFEILQDPVITPCGITYERKDIEEHLQRVGHFDPVTREKLTQDQLIPNFSMKEVVDGFMADNEWALDY